MKKVRDIIAQHRQLSILVAFMVVAIIFSGKLGEETKASDDASFSLSSQGIEDSARVERLAVIPLDYTIELPLSARVTSRADLTVTADVSGRVLIISPDFAAGKSFNKGDLLLKIDPTDYQLALEATLADYETAKSALKLELAKADIAIKDWADVFPDKPITELASRAPNVAIARATLQGAIARKKAAEIDLKRTEIFAPFDGKVISSSLEIGQLITPNDTLGTLVNNASIEVSAPISGMDLAGIKPNVGQAVSLESASGIGQKAEGVISRIGATLDPRTQMATLYIAPSTADALTLGEFVTVRIKTDNTIEALDIPRNALVNGDMVWIEQDGETAMLQVEVIKITTDRAIIKAPEGAPTLIEAVPGLQRGQKVTLIPTTN